MSFAPQQCLLLLAPSLDGTRIDMAAARALSTATFYHPMLHGPFASPYLVTAIANPLGKSHQPWLDSALSPLI